MQRSWSNSFNWKRKSIRTAIKKMSIMEWLLFLFKHFYDIADIGFSIYAHKVNFRYTLKSPTDIHFYFRQINISNQHTTLVYNMSCFWPHLLLYYYIIQYQYCLLSNIYLIYREILGILHIMIKPHTTIYFWQIFDLFFYLYSLLITRVDLHPTSAVATYG